jgi:hypothetical protein
MSGWISEKQAHWLASLGERYAIASFVRAVESGDFDYADLNLAWIFHLFGLPVDEEVDLWMARPRRVCKGTRKDGALCQAEVAKGKDYCPNHADQGLRRADA